MRSLRRALSARDRPRGLRGVDAAAAPRAHERLDRPRAPEPGVDALRSADAHHVAAARPREGDDRAGPRRLPPERDRRRLAGDARGQVPRLQDQGDQHGVGRRSAPGDVVTRVNGIVPEHPEEADAALRSLEKAPALKVEFEREGKAKTLELPIVDYEQARAPSFKESASDTLRRSRLWTSSIVPLPSMTTTRSSGMCRARSR